MGYAATLFNPELSAMFPQPAAASSRGVLQLARGPTHRTPLLLTLARTQLDALDASGSNPLSASGGACEAMPAGFLESFTARLALDDSSGAELRRLFCPLFSTLSMRASTCSLLGPWQAPLGMVCALAAQPALLHAMAQHASFCPAVSSGRTPGRTMEATSLLGPFLAVSALPDELAAHRTPPVAELFNSSRRSDVASATSTVQMYSCQLVDRLAALLLLLVKGEREGALAFVARFLEANAGRSKLQMDGRACASHGACVNLAAVMLRLCAPFFDASPTGNAKQQAQFAYIRPGYTAQGRIPCPPEETRLAATAAEAASWAAQTAPPACGWHFVCECFFLTQRSLNLGLIKTFAELGETAAAAQQARRDVAELEAARPAWTGTPQAPAYQQRLEEAQNEAAYGAVTSVQMLAALTEPRLLADTLSFYRLLARWLLHTAGAPLQPDSAQPLPSPPPEAFTCLPEALAEDVAEVLLAVSTHAPQALQGARLDDFMAFLVLILGAPEHARNPYLRAKCVEVLRLWMPQTPSTDRELGAAAYTRALFEGHPLALAQLVPNLLRLHVDIEFGGGRSVFYDKQNIRYAIGNLLEYLWRVGGHAQAWRSLAGSEFYTQFVNMLINDAIYQLGEALKIIGDVRELEEMRADGRFAALPPREQAERTRATGALRSYLLLAMVHIRIMRFTSADGVCARPFLRPEMVDRVGAMLNYFLAFLAGPERGKLRLPAAAAERCGWDPKELLAQLCGIYVNLHSAGGPTFAAAVSRDERSYRDDNFAEASHVVRSLGLLRDWDADALERFAESARAHAASGAEDDELYADFPGEFEDMLMNHLMSDPVRLPTGDYVVDRPTIARHLLSSNTCPFTRAPLALEQLVADVELQRRIEAWKAERRAGRMVG